MGSNFEKMDIRQDKDYTKVQNKLEPHLDSLKKVGELSKKIIRKKIFKISHGLRI